MRMVKYLVVLAVLLLFPGMAMAVTGEQVVSQQVIVPSFDIWQHSNGTWQDTDGCGQPDYYGWKGKTYSKAFTLPESEWQGKYKLTRAEVTYPFAQEQFNNSGRLEDWKKFKRNYLTKTPANYSVAKAGENLDEGKVTAQWTFDLAPEWLDLKDPTVREQLGMDEKSFSNMAQGWRWYLPVLVTWYGVPEKVSQPPDFSVTFDRHVIDNADPGDEVELTATYKLNESYDKPETAKLAAIHAVGGGEYSLALEPVNPSDALDVNGTVNFNPGETKQYKVTATVQGRNSKILAKILPTGGEDADWSNNSDEAQIRLNQNLWVELNGDAEQETREGNSVIVNAEIFNESGEMIVTPVVWKLDGKVIKETSNFDIISQGADSVTITPQAGSYTVTVEVNPDRDKPANEATFDDNKDSCTLNVAPPLKEESGDVQIIGPDSWDALKPYPFTVKISGYLPYERYRNRDGHIRYRSKTYNMNVNTHGEGVLTLKWTPTNQFGNPQETMPVVRNWSENYSRSSGSFTKSFNYEFPDVGMRGLSKSNLVIEVTDSRFGTARKVVIINPAPVKTPDYKLTK